MIKLIKQIIKFGIVGGLSTAIDLVLLFVFTEFFGIYYLWSAAMSFSISLIFNYICSMHFVFQRKEDAHKGKEFLLFFILSVCGLGINQLLLWILVEQFTIHYMLSKILATGVVMVWSFVTRKIFLEKKDK
ncbi:GtrA family protein [Lachnospiraceae bacterium ZAX-1]